MTLEQFRRQRGWSLERLAAEIGIEGRNAARTVQRYERGDRIPRPAQMARIVAATHGAVQPGDFYGAHGTSPSPAPAPGAVAA